MAFSFVKGCRESYLFSTLVVSRHFPLDAAAPVAIITLSI
jgi:hypothetical protein